MEKKIKVINFWSFQKTINSIEQANQSKNTVVTEKDHQGLEENQIFLEYQINWK